MTVSMSQERKDSFNRILEELAANLALPRRSMKTWQLATRRLVLG